jgi:hypothetical protein
LPAGIFASKPPQKIIAHNLGEKGFPHSEKNLAPVFIPNVQNQHQKLGLQPRVTVSLGAVIQPFKADRMRWIANMQNLYILFGAVSEM